MAIVLTDISAARFWTSYGAPGVPSCSYASTRAARCALASSPTKRDAELARDIGLFADGEALHALVSKASTRRAFPPLTCHVLSSDLPSQSLCHIERDLYVTSPGLTLSSLGPSLSIPELVFVASWFCGIFALDRSAGGGNGHGRHDVEQKAAVGSQDKYESDLPRRTAPTNTNNMRSYVASIEGVRGSGKALTAISFAAERARSPMEIVAFLLLCLPPRWGGYSLPKPLLNQPVTLVAGQPLEADMWWPKPRIVVEYFGEPHYADKSSMRRDVRRANSYTEEQLTFLTITKEHIDNLDLLDDVAATIFRMINKRKRLPKDFRKRQIALIKQLERIRRDLR